MFDEAELIEYEKEFEKLDKKLFGVEKRSILDFLYSLGVISYEVINKEENN